MKKKAFTLTELLVVVVIIGVLAAVVLPKFRQVIESRKTTEAEGIMMAVRNEQHARCLLDRGYTNDPNQLASLPKNLGKNYTYMLSATGLSAKEKNNKYTLRIKSYGDGGICCEGDGCTSLSKDYPSCSSYNVSVNTECAAEAIEKEPTPQVDEPVVPPQVCTPGSKREIVQKCGTETGWKCNEDGSGWKNYEESCEYTEQEKTSCECDDTPAQTADCDDYCLAYYGSQKNAIETGCLGQYETVGSFTIKRTCVDGKWKTPSSPQYSDFEPADWQQVCFEKTEFTCDEWINNKGKTCKDGRKESSSGSGNNGGAWVNIGGQSVWMPGGSGSGYDPNKRVSGAQFNETCCKQPTYKWVHVSSNPSYTCKWVNAYGGPHWAWQMAEGSGSCNCNDTINTSLYENNTDGYHQDSFCLKGTHQCYGFTDNASIVHPYLPANFFSNKECDEAAAGGGYTACVALAYPKHSSPAIMDERAIHTYKCVATEPYQ